MNTRLDGRYYVHYTCPVTGDASRVPQSCQLGRAVIAGNVEEVCKLTRQAQRDLARQIRTAELRGRSGRSLAWATLRIDAIRQGKTFTIYLMPTVQP